MYQTKLIYIVGKISILSNKQSSADAEGRNHIQFPRT